MSLQNSQQRILENFIVIWLDADTNEDDGNVKYSINQLQHVVNSVKTCIHPDQCIDYLTDIKDEKAFMIVSGSFDPEFVSLIHDIPQLYAIYVFCSHPTAHERWSIDYHKFKGVFSEMKLLCKVLNQDIRQANNNWIPISLTPESSPITLNQLDQSFMYSQLLKEILLKMEYNEEAKEEFVEFCLEQHIENETTIQVIGEFERDYDHPSPIWWYTRECFIYSMLNKALRTQNIEIILKMGFFLRDLHRQIEHLHSNIDRHNRLTVVYRGQGMLNVEFDKIVKNKGGLLSFNNFLSTSLDQEGAYARADSSRDDPELTGVFFRLEIDSSISSAPFALLDEVSYFSDSEKEILFSMHTIFRISEMKQIDDRRLWEVKLTLTSDNDEQLKCLTDYMRSEIQQQPNWVQLIILIFKMGELNKAEEICYRRTESVDYDAFTNAPLLHYIIGLITGAKRDQKTSLSHLEQMLKICQKLLPADHPFLAELYSNIGSNHRSAGEYSIALSYNIKALEIMKKILPSNHADLSGMHINIGAVYRSMGQFSNALTHLKNALEIRQKSLPPIHPDLARSHCNIGELYQSMGEYSTALTHLEKALEIQQKCLPPNHPVLAVSHNNIGTIYRSMNRYPIALANLEKAIEIQQKSLPLNHPDLATSYNDIGVVYQSMSDNSTALTHFKKALEIRQKSLATNHPDLAKSYNNIGLIHWLMGEHSTALSLHKKALEIRESSLSPDHPDLAASYNNIGLVYRSMGQYSTAFSYLKKALEIRQKSLSPNHPDLAMAHSNVAVVCQRLGHYDDATQHALTAIDVGARTLFSNHPTMQMYHNHLKELLHKKQ